MAILAIDLDHTIHNPDDVLPGYKMGRPVPGAVEALHKLSENYDIVIHCVWASTPEKVKAIADWCKYFDVPYLHITNQKPDADIYIDDKGYRFENWDKTLDFINNMV